ncbi:Glucuronoyl esterase catalytic domain from Hypocrea Jecorina [Lineolata rhizophorae]|uniref:(4-O-methyl)-D-glucuronate--lignin esterase n=1 Tax=Lineolata rhizophorae TaxID=578093 RepID=A0A6A6NQL2_9PEZI|nr:Glucuronoyl esterase catalytic domain from Hypocrea Jecorina [Lineolata rhizophorae]
MRTYLVSALLAAAPAIAAPFRETVVENGSLKARQADCPALPSNLNVQSTSSLPDPFYSYAKGERITSASEWECQRDEIEQLFEQYELGDFPATVESVDASYSGGTLSITVNDQGQSIQFSVSISGGGNNAPAIIAYGYPSIPIPSGVATITFSNDDIAAQQNTGSRGQGKFYDLYGSQHSAGALTAWAWGVDRIIDALEQVDAGIDPTRVGVTGCSRNGKGAMVAGALVQRIALAIPQESGSGGAACWRVSDWQQTQGQNVQTASQIITENVWFSQRFDQYVNNVNSLPVDHHMLAGMVAPRGQYVIENTSMEWLGAQSTFQCMNAAALIYEALGVSDHFGYSQVGGHNHCQFPSEQNSEIEAFINRFLLDQASVQTNVMRSDGNFNFDQSQWAPWDVPDLGEVPTEKV